MRQATNSNTGKFVLSVSVEERFWSKIDKTDSCWNYTGYTIRGYGHFWDGYKHVKAHRWSYSNLVSEIPTGLLVCHHCDNPSCVNPEHLFLGTNDDNMRDKWLKGRNCYGDKNGSRTHRHTKPRGEKHCKSKVSDTQVQEIISRYKSGGITQKELANEYGVRSTTISNYVTGYTRKPFLV